MRLKINLWKYTPLYEKGQNKDKNTPLKTIEVKNVKNKVLKILLCPVPLAEFSHQIFFEVNFSSMRRRPPFLNFKLS